MELGHITSQDGDSGKYQKYSSLYRTNVVCRSSRLGTAQPSFSSPGTDLLHDFDQITSHSSALHIKQDKDPHLEVIKRDSYSF